MRACKHTCACVRVCAYVCEKETERESATFFSDFVRRDCFANCYTLFAFSGADPHIIILFSCTHTQTIF